MWTAHPDSVRCIPSVGMVQPTSRQGRVRSLAACQRNCYAGAPAVLSNSSSDLSMACITTESFRATATAARLKPMRSRSLRPQSHKALSAELRVRMTHAASYRRARTWWSPRLEICPS